MHVEVSKRGSFKNEAGMPVAGNNDRPDSIPDLWGSSDNQHPGQPETHRLARVAIN